MTARAVMTRAAAAGFPRAINDLGVMMETGVGGRSRPGPRGGALRGRGAGGRHAGGVEPRRSAADPHAWSHRPGGRLRLVPLGRGQRPGCARARNVPRRMHQGGGAAFGRW